MVVGRDEARVDRGSGLCGVVATMALAALVSGACDFEVPPPADTPDVVERELVASDGSREFPAGWWDTRHLVACSFTRIDDGVFRCLPPVATSYLVSARPDCGESFRAVLSERDGFFRTRDDRAGAVPGFYRIAERFEADELYRVQPLVGCAAFFTPGWSIVELVPDPPLVEVSQPSQSPLDLVAGSRLAPATSGRALWTDTELDADCRFAAIGDQVRCVPAELEQVQSINLFTNPRCDNADEELLPATERRFAITTAPALRVLEVDGPHRGPVYRLTFDGCLEAEVADELVLARPITGALVRGLLNPGPDLDF